MKLSFNIFSLNVSNYILFQPLREALLRSSLMTLGIVIAQVHIQAVDIYVSPDGHGSNTGNIDSPFATIDQAIAVVKKTFIKNPGENCTIWLMQGVYRLNKPLELISEEILNKNASLTISGVPGDTAIISGGTVVTDWAPVSKGLWKSKVQQQEPLKNTIRELFINNRRAIRARHPNEGYLRVAQVGADRRTNFFFEENDFPDPSNISNTELVLLHDWSISRIPVKEIDFSIKKLIAIDSVGAREPDFFNLDNWEAHPRYFLENDKQFLDTNFEWYYEEKDNTLWLQLPPDQNPNKQEIIIPVSEGLVKLIGSQKQPLKNITIKNLIFEHSAWTIPSRGYAGVQACHYDNRSGTTNSGVPGSKKKGWAVVPAAIKGEWVENSTLTNCTIRHMGGSGVWLTTGSKDNTISNCKFSDISGNGVMIGEGQDRQIEGVPWWKAAPEQASNRNSIEGNTVSDCGVQFYGAVGIWCGLTANTSIFHNKIYGLPYTGISIGWMWSPVPTPCQGNILENNHIHHVMQELSDGGGIYMLGLQPGSRILRNRIHNVNLNAGRAESNGLFLDEGTTDVIVADNLIYEIAKSPLRFHKATTNLVRNNHFFCKKNIPPIMYNSTEVGDIIKEKNYVVYEDDTTYENRLKLAIKKWASLR